MQPQKGKMPVTTLYDISGSANWTNEPDIALVVHRNFETNQAEIHVQKGARQSGRPARQGHARPRRGDRTLLRAGPAARRRGAGVS
jgi:hypothetical protein